MTLRRRIVVWAAAVTAVLVTLACAATAFINATLRDELKSLPSQLTGYPLTLQFDQRQVFSSAGGFTLKSQKLSAAGSLLVNSSPALLLLGATRVGDGLDWPVYASVDVIAELTGAQPEAFYKTADGPLRVTANVRAAGTSAIAFVRLPPGHLHAVQTTMAIDAIDITVRAPLRHLQDAEFIILATTAGGVLRADGTRTRGSGSALLTCPEALAVAAAESFVRGELKRRGDAPLPAKQLNQLARLRLEGLIRLGVVSQLENSYSTTITWAQNEIKFNGRSLQSL
ncbi:MAG: hypothetical protein HOI95_24945 [Chromatiales bacterium]|nr:hypothetical protein [Chromatiales bacterium]